MLRSVLMLALTVFLAGCGDDAQEAAGDSEPPSGPVVSVRDLGRTFYAVLVDGNQIDDPEQYVQFARDACSQVQICVVGVWDDEARAATALPMSNRQRIAQVFSYGKNETTGSETTLWNCDLYPQYRERASCIPMPLMPR
jgi:hypothetical protein